MAIRRLIVVASLILVVAAPLAAQAPPNLASARVRYNSLKNSVKPDGELKAQIDAIDKEIAEALRLGQTSQVRRLHRQRHSALGQARLDRCRRLRSVARAAHGSGVRRFVRALCGPARAGLCAIDLQLTADADGTRVSRVPLLAQPAKARRKPARSESSPTSAATCATAPLAMDLDLSGIAGRRLHARRRTCSTARPRSAPPACARGAEGARREARRAGEAGGISARERPRRHPLSRRLRAARQSRLDGVGPVRPRSGAHGRRIVAASAKGGKDPFVGRTGDFERHYLLDGARRDHAVSRLRARRPTTPRDRRRWSSRYTGWRRRRRWMDRLPTAASRARREIRLHRGLAARLSRPMVSTDYSYGSDAASRRKQALSEQDVMQVLARMRQHYKIDDSRIYLMGHSMGADRHLVPRRQIPGHLGRARADCRDRQRRKVCPNMNHIPQFVVHGDADSTVPVVRLPQHGRRR